jgi:type IV pilus assembly protein PilA
MKRNKGFTLIELLVVIAIIGILSAVVLASLNTARAKGKDASAKSSIESIRASADIYYNGPGLNSYGPAGSTGNACTDADVARLIGAVQLLTATAPVCVVTSGNNGGYTVYDILNDGTYFCIDNTGFAGDPTGNGGTALTAGSAAGNYTAGVYCKHP